MTSSRRPLFLALLSLFLSINANGQQPSVAAPQEKSLADLAREANKNKTARAKIVISDETLKMSKGPIPEISTEGADNSQEVADSITEYRKTHGTKETEDLVHAWYDKYYSAFMNADEENKALLSRQQERIDSQQDTYRNAADARKYRQLHDAEGRSARNDQNKWKQNGMLAARIKQTFAKVRAELSRQGYSYEWFKIPPGTGNGITRNDYGTNFD